ncbi:MAG: hypothetical protein PVH88_13395 [Ignavibacteria bacterium]
MIDVLGSAVIGGMVILLTISINLQMNDLSEDIFMDSIVQGNATSSASDFKYDLYKIGYGVTGNKFITADSTNLYYYSDFNNDGTIDSIHFSLGPTDSLSGTTNPNDRPLYRTLNGSSANKSVLLIVNKFEFIYYDSVGNTISYDSLAYSSGRNKIRTIEAKAKFQAELTNDTLYQSTDWNAVIRPKNLR